MLDPVASDALVIDNHRHLIDEARRQWEAARASSSASGSASSASDSATDAGSGGGPAIDSIAGFRLERLVHRGGQGAVYRAVQLSTGRTVALKVMRERSLPLGPERARFEREVEILGELDHPNIVRVIESGSANGRDFLVMDYIDGMPLDRAGAVAPDSRASVGAASAGGAGGVRSTLRLFAEVCDAVHAAHLHGVIHRDLKPGNILVDSHGRPRIVDFGLAKRTAIDAGDPSAASALTETGQFLGSLPWASPEQVSGPNAGVDLRSDVYSLGVILYQLLTGAFPYVVTGAVGEITRNIQSVEPHRPSELATDVDDELETILLTALRKEPERRYQSAGELARDLRRYLAGEVIEAKRASLRYVLGKQLRRHRLVVAIAAVLALVVIGAAIVSISLWQQAASERDLKESQRLRAESINAVFHRILASANPEGARGGERTVAEALDDAVVEIESGSLAAIPDVEASARITIAEAYLALGRLAETRAQVDRALSLLAAMPGPHDLDRARAFVVLGRLGVVDGAHADAARHLQAALEILRAHGIPPRGDSAPHAQDQIPAIAHILAGNKRRLGLEDEATALQDEALAYAIARYGPDHPETRRVRLGIRTSRYGGARAVELIEEELALNRESLGPRHPATLRSLSQLAAELHLKGRIDESEERYLEAIELARSIYGDRHQDLLRIVTNLNWLYGRSKRFDKAVELLRDWQPAALATFGAKNVRYAEFLMLQGSNLVNAGDLDAGEKILREALDLLASIGRDQGWQGAECRVFIGRVIIRRIRENEGDATDAPGAEGALGVVAGLEEAERLAREALAITFDENGSLPMRHAQARLLLGDMLIRRGAFEEAEEHLLAAHAVLEPRKSMPHLRADAVNLLTRLYERWDAADPGLGKAADAAAWRERLDSDPR